MDHQTGLVPHGQVWGDKVKGSWWKAIIIILLYAILTILFQGIVMQAGVKISGVTPNVEDLQNMEFIFKNLQAAQWYYHLSQFVLIVILLAVAHGFKMKFFDLDHLTRERLLFTFKVYGLMFIIQIIYSYAIPYIAPEYTTTANQAVVDQLFLGMHKVGAFINIVILTPIIEEFVIRGLIMKYIFPLMPYVGFIVSTLVFTFLHSPGNLIDFFVYFIMACGITYVYWRTRRLEYPILFHMLNNGIAFMAMLMQSK